MNETLELEKTELLSAKMTWEEAAEVLLGEKEWRKLSDLEKAIVKDVIADRHGELNWGNDFAEQLAEGIWSYEEIKESQDNLREEVFDVLNDDHWVLPLLDDDGNEPYDAEDDPCCNVEDVGRYEAYDKGYDEAIKNIPCATIDYKALGEKYVQDHDGELIEYKRFKGYVFFRR